MTYAKYKDGPCPVCGDSDRLLFVGNGPGSVNEKVDVKKVCLSIGTETILHVR